MRHNARKARTPMNRLLRLRPPLAAAVLAAWLLLPGDAASQPSSGARAKEAELESLLAALEEHVQDYAHSVPSFLCKEHVVSEMEPTPTPGGSTRIVTDSVFRVRRTLEPDGQTTLKESHALQAVDGKPAPADATEETAQLIAPMAVFGIFSNGLSLVAAPAQECFRFKLHPARPGHPKDRIAIEFDELPPQQRASDCPTNGSISGRAQVDQASLRVLRLDTKTRDHINQQGFRETWEWGIDYAPVALSGKTFWMPTTIRSRAIPDPVAAQDFTAVTNRRSGGSTLTNTSSRPLTYNLNAKYTDYHLLNVVSRVVPEGEVEKLLPRPETAPPPGH